ncbi:hypothetical protein EDC04DRAFT_3058052 [Pisolithus marmoratus]|nr:hypothetical protein EDC04DRAFT_3058052 [Pisolithus marmoratus]
MPRHPTACSNMLPQCGNSGLFDISNACVQSFWSSFVPALLTVTLVLFSLVPLFPTLLARVRDGIKTPFRPYVVLEEDETLETSVDTQDDSTNNIHTTPFIYQWRLALLVFIALLEFFAWTAFGIYDLVRDEGDSRIATSSIVIGLTWLYNVLKPALRPRPTAYIDVFILYITHFVFGVIRIGTSIYYLHTTPPTTLEWIGMSLNLVAITAGLGIISIMPLQIPSDDLRGGIYDKYSPEDYASIFEWATYSWVYPLIKRGNIMEMKHEDVWDLTPAMRSAPIFEKFSGIERPSLLRRLIAANQRDLMLDILLTIITVLLSYSAPYFLRRILDLIEKPTLERRSEAYALALLAFICAVLKGEADAQHLFFGRRASARVSAQLMNAIYDKALKRKDYSGVAKKELPTETGPTRGTPKSNDPQPGADIGKVVTVMAIDASKVSAIVASAYLLYGGPFEITLACAMLYSLMGFAAFAGFVVILVAWALHIYVTRLKIPLQKGLLTSRDRRMSTLHELVNAVRFIKFFTWEDSWIARVMKARDREMDWLKRSRINSIASAAVWAAAPVLVSFCSFFAYVRQGNRLTPSIAFTTIALIGMLRQPLNVFPNFIMQIFEARVSLDRVEAFLNEEEISDRGPSPEDQFPDTETLDGGLAIEGGRFKWNEVGDKKGVRPRGRNGELTPQPTVPAEEAGQSVGTGGIVLNDRNHFELRDITVRFPDGELSLIIGPTGCGKTALLLALLGEMTTMEGKLVRPSHGSGTGGPLVSSTISYAAQTPWLQRGTVKENILFGYPYDEQRYEDVVECCALVPDLDSWEEGDHTQVGDRGSNLSGGQKTRVALARAVYAQTQYVLLDDPFSSIDIKTSRFLYERLFCGPLLQDRTVILVTHHVGLVLPKVSYIVHMQDGRITTQGYVKDLQASGRLPPVHPTLPEEDEEEPVNAPRKRDQLAKKRVTEESVVSGGVTRSTYTTYLEASSYWMWGGFVLLIIFSHGMTVVEKLWIREWGRAYGDGQTESSTLHSPSKNTSFGSDYLQKLAFFPDAGDRPLFYVWGYAIVGFIMASCNIASATTLYFSGLKASGSLFQRLLGRVVHATLPWHDATPRGRILNRFSKDMDSIDITLSNNVSTVSNALVNFTVAIITVIIFFPGFIIPAIAIAFFYRFVAIRYLNINRQLRRMESTSRSPIFSGFGELLDGIVTIRAFQSERRFREEFYKKVDVANKMYYNSWMTSRWLLFNYDVLGAFAVLATTLLALSGYVGAGTAGLSITSAMTFTMSVYLVCRFWASLELELNAVERVAEYLAVPQDPPAIIENSRPPAYWPSTSSTPFLAVEDLCVRYAPDLPRVLSKVSFTLNAPARIGVVGRTGSGKSTLIISLLRFVDPERGRIVIDGIDIANIGVRDLRSRITYIPEDAILFSGSVRDNIDPFKEHEDIECFDALRRVQLLGDDTQPQGSSSGSSQAVTGASSGVTLDTEVAPEGANFSLGQRQLIAMARALLRRTPIVVLDEATSSVDYDADEKIQATLREQFKDSLLITVAHRLSNIIDYDRLIVLQDGKVAEFDTPLELFYKEGGVFRDICRSSESYKELEATVLQIGGVAPT